MRGGRVHVRMRVRICPEVIQWLLGFGADVQIVAPVALRDRIARVAARMAKMHGKTTSLSDA